MAAPPIILQSTDIPYSRTGRSDFMAIRWVGATTAGHQVIITNQEDTEIWRAVADAANFMHLDTRRRSWPYGFKVSTLDSGRLYFEWWEPQN